MINLAISGCKGRMGTTIADFAIADKDIKISAVLEHKNHPNVQDSVYDLAVSTDNNSIEGSDVLIEFTLPEGTIENLKAAVKHNVRMVIGTTGFSNDQIKEIQKASKSIPIVFASNMSMGVNVFWKAVELVAKSLPGISDTSVGETHHIHKKDKPSGTAKTIKEIAESASNKDVRFADERVTREGEVVGFHDIIFETEYDTITLSHNAKDRSMFAKGSIEAAKFLMNKEPGLYDMQDVLGLK